MSRASTVLTLAPALFSIPVAALAYSSGPPADRVALCNARASCRDFGCHDDVGPSVSVLELETAPLPATYQPGELLRFLLSVVDPDPSRQRFGFQIGVVSDCPFPAQAGDLTPLEPLRTELAFGSGGLVFLEHICQPPFDYDHCGYVPAAPGLSSWGFEWLAPPAGTGPITFYWAINSADGSADPSGDYISLGEATLSPAIPTCPGRIETLVAVKSACDPGAPGVPRVALSWDPVPDASGYRLYRTENRDVLADPRALGATLLVSACDDPGSGPLEHYTVVGICSDGSDGAP